MKAGRLIGWICCLAVLATISPSWSQTRSPPSTSYDSREQSTRFGANGDVARTNTGRPEYIAIGPAPEITALSNRLIQLNAAPLRSHSLTVFGLEVLVIDMGPGGSLQILRDIAAEVAPFSTVDANNLYRYAQGSPRVYAAQMVGMARADTCPLRSSVRIGMIDGPVDLSHASLTSAQITHRHALLPSDRTRGAAHGTAVASLLVGEDPSGVFSGFATGAHLYSALAFALEHDGIAADIERIAVALDWLAANRVKVINMSFAGPPNAVLERMLDSADARQIVLVAAAGNSGQEAALYPAAASPVIAVTAVDAAGRQYNSATSGRHIEFAAPGVDVFVALNRRGGYASGTSYAAPIVAALAARQVRHGGAQEIRRALRNNIRDLGPAGRDGRFGWGLVQSPGC